MKYETCGWLKFAEEDVWENGCIGKSSTSDGRDTFSDDTLPGLIEKLKAFAGTDDDIDCLFDSCDEYGRLDIQVMECADGTVASNNEIEQWKAGNRRLWLACYIFRISEVNRKVVSLAGLNK